MGFENPRESNFIIPVSDTQAYKQFGNAVVVPVVQEIARSIRPGLVDENMATGLQPDLLLDAG